LTLASATAAYLQTKRLEQANEHIGQYKTQADTLRDKVEVLLMTLDNQTKSIEAWERKAKDQEAKAKQANIKADKLAQEAEELKQRILQNPPKPETKNYLDWILGKEN
jgi:chromosome segregation ATPase